MTKPPRLVIHIPVLSPNFVPTEGVPPDGNTGYHPVWSRGQTVLFARSANGSGVAAVGDLKFRHCQPSTNVD